MGSAAELLGPILVGYLACQMTHISRYWFKRLQGYETLFLTLLVGWCVYLVTHLWTSIVALPVVLYWPDLAERLKPTEYTIVLLNLGTALIASLVLNSRERLMDSALLVSELSGDLVESVLQRASMERGLVELTTESGKSYIGFPRDSGINTAGDSDLSVLPPMSGYRDSTTKVLNITTYYFEILEDEDIDPADLSVALPKASVVSARRFDPDANFRYFSASKSPDLVPGSVT